MNVWNILVINPGSTSTKLAIYKNTDEFLKTTIKHDTEELSSFSKIAEQEQYRTQLIFDFLIQNNFDLKNIDAVVARGGLLEPMESGTYLVNDKMCEFLQEAKGGEHASNLGALIAKKISKQIGVNAYIVDPVVVDEMLPEAKISGHPFFTRKSIFHALNQKSVAKNVCQKLNKQYEKCNFIVAHIGGGISVASHKNGKVVDVNNALNGEGPFSPERSGTLPAGQLVDICFSGEYTKQQIHHFLNGQGGLVAYLGTNDLEKIIQNIDLNKDKNAENILKAMIYQIAKQICSCLVNFKVGVDRIIITGGLANNTYIINKIKEYIDFIAPVEVYPGEREMESLVLGCLRVLKKEEKIKEF